MRWWVFLLCVGCGSSTEAGDGGVDATAPDVGVPDVAAPDAPDEACVPDCTGKSCGDDGCGGSCGTCAAPLGCGDKGTCVAACPCFFGACNNCYCATAAEQYAVQNNCSISAYQGNEGNLLSCSGSTTSPATWTAGTTCANGCVVAPPKTPDYCAPPPGGHHLWIAFDATTAPPMTATKTFFDCVFQHSNFDALATAYPYGRSFSGVGGVAQLKTSCSVVHPYWCASIGDDSTALQCIENQTQWNVAPDDVVLYYPATATSHGSACTYSTSWDYTGGCLDGRNHWHVPIKLPNSTSVSVEAAFGFTGSGQNCQTALGLHEVYEAAADSAAADCCNGQNGKANCKGLEPSPPFGWYSGTGCGATWELQYLSPANAEWVPSACTQLTFN